ncbi:MAG: threonine/serine exporter family protein [Pseudolactococcus laudensis]|uniref:Threonine/serine exporter family protein n=1 Tax=Pseudolactococcus laudensis TaxID=1494461 RepID=A0A7V8N1Q1_9LACT|nr:threonine/serine exporter family protein [Lactococcus laudensis]MBA0017074.1 threonine/serine exporter family protein [Lactococcus laudensis]MBR2763352.1 threonine/serine exporter family protein [Lactococcus sp.]MBW9281935.1 threonine/serine exporter [Lactococcus laudensis]CCK18709.1 integral membrane protein [Lactococcus raffinolactis 4877]
MVIFLNLVGQTILAYISVFAFGIMLNIPRRTLNRAGIVGASAWLIYELVFVLTQNLLDKNWRIVLGTMLASAMIGVMSLSMSRAQKVPVLIYNIPGIFPLVPGAQAYQVVRNLVVGNREVAGQNFELLVIIAGAIVIGFWIAEIINRLRAIKPLT